MVLQSQTLLVEGTAIFKWGWELETGKILRVGAVDSASKSFQLSGNIAIRDEPLAKK